MRSVLLAVLALALGVLLPVTAMAHPVNISSARAQVRADGKVSIRLHFDILAFVVDATPEDVADGPMNALLDGPASELQDRLSDASSRLRSSLKLHGGTLDGMVFPTAKELQALVAGRTGQRLPLMATVVVSGHLAKGQRTMGLRFPEVLGTVVLTTELPYQEPISEPVEPGMASKTVTVPTAEEIAKAAKSMEAPRPHVVASEARPVGANVVPKNVAAPKKESVQPKASTPAGEKPAKVIPAPRRNDPPVVEPDVEQPSPPVERSWFGDFVSFVKVGFEHIVPEGLDHVLFVLGLFLLSTRTKDLVKQITAFTVAHSLTLGLALFGVVRLPGSVVEPLIALSIVFVAIENVFVKEVRSWRVLVVFGFGLVHGLGFAGALQDTGLAQGNLLTALLGFNVGVELGQLSVVAAALLAVGWFRQKAWYRGWVVVPGSVLIAITALVWTVQRVFGLG